MIKNSQNTRTQNVGSGVLRLPARWYAITMSKPARGGVGNCRLSGHLARPCANDAAITHRARVSTVFLALPVSGRWRANPGHTAIVAPSNPRFGWVGDCPGNKREACLPGPEPFELLATSDQVGRGTP